MREHAPFNVVYTEPERPWRLAVDHNHRIYFTGYVSTSFSVLSPGEEQPRRVQCEDIMFARGIAVATEGGGVVVYIIGNHSETALDAATWAGSGLRRVLICCLLQLQSDTGV